MSATSVPGRRAMRSDAQHNSERLIAAARAAFAEHGADASLIQIARQAGVGSATLYRHFPSREALLEAVYRDDVETLATHGRQLGETTPPLEALTTWLRAFARYTTTCRGMKELMMAACSERPDLTAWCRQTLCSVGASLLSQAQQAGVVRPGISAHQVLSLIIAATEATERTDASGHGDQLLAIVIDGLRYSDENGGAPTRPYS